MKTTICLVIAASLVLMGTQAVHARGFGGGGGGFHTGGVSGGGFHEGGFSGGGYRPTGFEGGGYRPTGFEGGGYRPTGFSGGAYRPGGYDRGDFHPESAAMGNFTPQRYEGYRGEGAGAYSARHFALPTDGAFGHNWAGTAAGYAAVGNRTVAVPRSVAAARGAAVRNDFQHYDAFHPDWYHNHPGAWFAAGWAAGRAWDWATWPAVGAWCGWDAGVAPVYYDYGANVTYQGDQVYYGTQPVATADQYYQQAAALAQSIPRPIRKPPTGCRWAFFRSCRASRPIPARCSNWRSTSRGPSPAIITVC